MTLKDKPKLQRIMITCSDVRENSATIPSIATSGDCANTIPDNTNSSLTAKSNTKLLNIKATKSRKLILHVDIRNTIIVADSVTNINVEQALNSYLTGVLWGQERNGEWCWASTEPTLDQPEPDTITYYKYLERSLVTTPEDRCHLRLKTGDFTVQDIGRRFRRYYDKHLELLRWRYDDENIAKHINSNCDNQNDSNIGNNNGAIHRNENRKPVITSGNRSNTSIGPISNLMVMTVDKGYKVDEYHYILPSFVSLINHLIETKRNFSIIIRTYGLDAPNVLSSIKHICRSEEHPNFPRKSNIHVRTKPGIISRKNQKPFFKLTCVDKVLKKRKVLIAKNCTDKHSSPHNLPANYSKKFLEFKYYKYFTGKLDIYRKLYRLPTSKQNRHKDLDLKTENEICRFFNTSYGVSGYVDDFIFWQKNGYSRFAGKPLWLVLPEFTRFDEFFGCFNKGRISSENFEPTIPPSLLENDDKVRHRNIPSLRKVKPLRKNQRTRKKASLASTATHHHIFFDDNIRVNDEDNIVDVRLYNKTDNNWRSLNLNEIKRCENVFLVQANLMESIENINYFIDKVEMCENNLETILQSHLDSSIDD